ncbi:MAG: amylo-alpha-1,6-glucosidase, partial [Victivallales bacterium]
LLNDPVHPYWGRYEGDEDTRRKPAYHNGTAWTWQFPAYCEAYYMIYGKAGCRTARSLLSSCSLIMNDGCISQLAEILDGDYPHTQRGCGAQAWGISEYYRVWKLLHE